MLYLVKTDVGHLFSQLAQKKTPHRLILSELVYNSFDRICSGFSFKRVEIKKKQAITIRDLYIKFVYKIYTGFPLNEAQSAFLS